jgi:hypothetical protein
MRGSDRALPDGRGFRRDTRAGQNYTCRIVRRVIDLPSGKQKKANR